MKFVGIVLIFVGIILVAGSAGDCDGACPELANSMTDMLLISAAGMATMIAGFFLVRG
jgi:hypothetical protein